MGTAVQFEVPLMEPERVPDNSRLVAALLALQASGKPLYGSFRGRPGNQPKET